MKKYLLAVALVFSVSMLFAQEDEKMDKKVPQEQTDTIDIDDIELEDIDFDDIEEDELSKESNFPWERFAVGGQLGSLQFGDVTNLGISPEIVYTVNPVVKVGVDGVFELTRVNRVWNGFQFVNADYKSDNIGGRVFTRIQPVQSFPIFAQVEYENLNQEDPYQILREGNQVTYLSVDQTVRNVNAGLGFNNGPYYIALMYNFMNSQNRDDFFEAANADLVSRNLAPQNFNNRVYPYNAVAFRGGLNIPLGQGNKNKKRDKNRKRKEKQESE